MGQDIHENLAELPRKTSDRRQRRVVAGDVNAGGEPTLEEQYDAINEGVEIRWFGVNLINVAEVLQAGGELF